KGSKALVKRLDALEEKLHNPRAKVSYDILAQKGGAQLYSQLAWLFELLKDADGPPTQGLVELYREQAGLLKKYNAEWQAIVKKDVRALNDLARKLALPVVVVPAKIKKGPDAPERGRHRPRSSRGQAMSRQPAGAVGGRRGAFMNRPHSSTTR